MRKLFFALTAASALAAIAPAAAQNYGSTYYGRGDVAMSTRIAQLDARLQAGIRAGLISRYEARSLNRQIYDLRQLERRYSYNGLSVRERQDLQSRIRETRRELRLADNNRYDRDTRYGYWDRSWDSGYYGQGGPLSYDQVCERRGSGLSGVVDSVFGRDCLEIGERAPSSLYTLPSNYRNRYSDYGNTLYRTDGRAIYEIDARSGRVIGIYGM
jgi:hypothetical protein